MIATRWAHLLGNGSIGHTVTVDHGQYSFDFVGTPDEAMAFLETTRGGIAWIVQTAYGHEVYLDHGDSIVRYTSISGQ